MSTRESHDTAAPKSEDLRARALDWISRESSFDSADDLIFRAFVDQLPETVLCFDAEGKIVYANQSWLAMRDLALDDCVGRFHADVVDPADRQMQLERLERLRALTVDDRVLEEQYAASGIGWRSVVYKAWFDRSGELRLFTSVGRDKTDQREARVAMEVANRRLADSNRDLQDFAHVASHDLQEPLRKIVTFSDRLASDYADQLDEHGLDYLERIRSASSRMQVLIGDLLTYSRVANGERGREPVRLDEVLAGVLSDLEVAIAECDATVSLGSLPTIAADAGQMRQLFQNLIGNALKFRSPDRAPVVQVTSERALRPGSSDLRATMGWSLAVTDNGIGFDEKYLDKIFTVFQRLHGRSEYSGSGVGLSVCRRIVERHEGELLATSALGGGTTFTVWLP